MGRKRKDRTLQEWKVHGSSLLGYIKHRRPLHKKIKSAMVQLNSPHASEPEITEQLEILNGTKYSLEDDWGSWIGRFKQIEKDAKRSKFYVSDIAYSKIMDFSKGSKYDDNATKSIEQLFVAFNSIGISNISQLYDLYEAFESFGDALQEKHKITLYSDDRDAPFSILTITDKIISKLASLKIKNFNDLNDIAKRIKEADEQVIAIRELNRRHKEESDELKNRLSKLTLTKTEPIKTNKSKPKPLSRLEVRQQRFNNRKKKQK